jgi:predicted AlkP superfamily pyrophosphatase or phosphodiesterase
MRKHILAFLAAACAVAATGAPRPKLVVAIAVDQFRYDYLTRFRSEYKQGLNDLLTRGAVFTNARYEHFPTVTAIGHSTFLSGATPSISGIIGNDWWERSENRNVTSVFDDKTKLLGGENGADGSSPQRLLVSTIGDELKMSNESKSKVIGISLKDRAAILPVGRMADGAFWFDGKTGNFVSSTYYFEELPGWVKDFNSRRPGDKYKGRTFGKKTLPPEPGQQLYESLPPTPFGNEIIEAFAERALQAEQLGRHGVTDLLAVSFSSNDYVGHELGPDSPEVHEISVLTDKLLGKFFAFLSANVGMENVLIVMTADHGVAPVPEVNMIRKMPGGRLGGRMVTDAIKNALTAKYGDGKWIVSPSEHSIYLNLDLIAQKRLDPAEVNKVAAQACMKLPHVFRVYTREQLVSGATLEDQVGRRVQNGFYVRRSADIEIMLEPYWIFTGGTGTTHGSTFSYDAHVPVIFMGPGIKPGRYNQTIAVNDIAPTLATMLDVETPSGSVGRALSEIME